MLDGYRQVYQDAILDTNRERALRVVEEARDRGCGPEEIVFGLVVPTVETLLNCTESAAGLSLAQHFMTAQITGVVVDRLLPQFEKKPVAAGRVVIGTSAGDFHGLGKTIVAGCLKARLLEVVDLGLNVTAERFVEAAEGGGCEVIAISSMMLHTARGENGCTRVRELLREKGLEGRIKVVVGGAPYRFDEGLYETVGADGWAESGLAAGPVIEAMLREVHGR